MDFFTLLIILYLAFAFVASDALLKNIWWIGSIFIIIMVFALIRQIKYTREFGFDFAEFVIILFQLGAIAVTIWLMTW